MVRQDIVDKVFGYKQRDVTQLKVFENNQHPMAKQIAGLAHYAIRETVGWGKNRVVLAMPKVIINKTQNFCIVSAFDDDANEFISEIQKLKSKGWKLEGGVSASNSKLFQSLSK